MVRSCTGEKNPYPFKTVKRKIDKKLRQYHGKYIVTRVPNITNICYGRDVGYKIEASGEIFPVADIKVREDGRGYGGQFKFEMILNQKSFAKRLEKAQRDVYGDE